MAQRGNRAKHVAGAGSPEAETPEPEDLARTDTGVVKTAAGGGMGKTSPKQRKAAARTAREADREASEVDADRLEDDFRTEKVPGPGPKDEDAGLATTKQLETHDLKNPSR